MMNQVKIYDIAGAAGVSLATVSRVLNHPEKVKESTRARVLKIIKEKGYKPNANARGLASRRSTTVAIVVPRITRASVAEMIQGIDDSAKKYGYTLRLFIGADTELQRDLWGDVIASSVDGILFMNDEMTPETFDLLQKTPVPVVFVNAISQTTQYASVLIEYEKCAYEITKEMIRRGNKKILFISTEHKYAVNDLKQKGYEKAMREHDLPVDIIYSSGDLSINEKDFNEYLDKRVPEVAMAVRDSMAISFMNIAMKKGHRVPDVLQVIGFQNTRYAVLSNPKLTCVEIPIYEIGNKAMSFLTELMKQNGDNSQKDKKDHPNLYVPYQVIWRESTK
ncbi:MAG TPA: LacI family DNA-binding transcriptional regulator [Bacilli bacterium]|jgi:LacI family transcriptional regulator|nr:LacI family DNA-binding transcriptional regulator [Bacilli bacterium]